MGRGAAERWWRVGELAEASGLTVRALHYFDEIGLLPPTERSDSGHRLYGQQDVRRLYRIIALRQLGLPLQEISCSLQGGPQELAEAVARQLDHVETELVHQQRLRRQLRTLHEAIGRGELSPDRLLETMEVIMHAKYFSDDQLAQFEQRHEAVGHAGFARWIDQVTTLAEQACVLADGNVDPADPRAQDLARRWAAFVTDLSGGDRAVVSAIYAKLDGEGAPAATRQALSQPAWDYLRRALAVGFG